MELSLKNLYPGNSNKSKKAKKTSHSILIICQTLVNTKANLALEEF